MNAFHANALASCAMNALGMFRSSKKLSPTWVTEYVPLSVRQVRKLFSVFAGTGAVLVVLEATCGLLGSATRLCSKSRKKCKRGAWLLHYAFLGIRMHRRVMHFGGHVQALWQQR